jgi:hypothetical protein
MLCRIANDILRFLHTMRRYYPTVAGFNSKLSSQNTAKFMPKQHFDHCFDFYSVTRCSFTKHSTVSQASNVLCLSKLHNKWTGQNGLTKQPPKSPDHTVLSPEHSTVSQASNVLCLSSKFHNKWTGQNGLTKRPPKSPDHTLILKSVHTECPQTLQGLTEKY